MTWMAAPPGCSRPRCRAVARCPSRQPLSLCLPLLLLSLLAQRHAGAVATASTTSSEEMGPRPPADFDGDGLAGGDDKCPWVPSLTSDVSDSDSDGTPDACDTGESTRHCVQKWQLRRD